MLITDRFVMLNFPKTGSTFARSVLKQLHEPTGIKRALNRLGLAGTGLQELLMMPYRFRENGADYPSQHGVFSQIPVAHRGKVVMSILRDPLERLISAYEFKHWARHPGDRLDELRKRFPNFPELNFEEYLRMSYDMAGPNSPPDGIELDIGPLTVQFIRFFARDPLTTIRALRPETDLVHERERHFAPVRFLHTENLRSELHDFLAEMGYKAEDLRFILEKPSENTTQRSRPNYLTPANVEEVLHRERFLYRLFPEYLPKGS